MIDGLKPYGAYRASPDRWLTQFPSTWERVRIKYLLREIDRRTQTGEEPLLSMRRDHGLVPLSQFSDKVAEPKALLAYKLVRPGELVVNRMQAGNGLVFVARIPGLISPDYAIFRPIREVNLDYLELLFRSYPMRAKFRSESTGLGTGTAGFLRLYGDSLGAIEICLPSADEQSLIVRFLNHGDRRIGRYIRAKKKLITVLNEQKQSIILRAVMRGLDSEVRLRPSGVGWLGDIPAHWRVARLKSLMTEAVAGPYGSSLTKAMYTTHGYRVYGQQQVIPDDFSVGDYYISPEKFGEMSRYRVFPDDVLISVMGTVGRVAVVPSSAEPGIINPRLVRYRPRFDLVRSRYLQQLLLSPIYQMQLLEVAKGTTMDGLNLQILGRLRILLPLVEEQDAILARIGMDTELQDVAISGARGELDLLAEYRVTLVSDIVTGKLDVREAAVRLPDPPSDVPEDDGTPLEDDSELDATELDDAGVTA